MTSVRAKLLVHITLAIFLVEAVLLAFSVMARKRQLLAAETETIRRTADVAGMLFSESAARLSAEQFDRFIGELAKTQKIHIMIVDQDMNSWTDHVMCGLDGGCRVPEVVLPSMKESNFHTVIDNDALMLHGIFPIRLEATGRVFDRLVVSRDISGMRSELMAYALRILGLVAVVIGVTVLCVYSSLKNIVLRPIHRIIEADAAEMNGDADRCRIPDREMPNDEFGDIMKMRAALMDKVMAAAEELQNINQTLEARVVERTCELQLAMDRLKRAQSQLVQSAKLAAMGEMSAGVYHELANPLTGILLLLEMARRESKNSPETVELIDSLESETKRLTAIASNLRGFSRKAAPPHPVLLTLAVRRACDIMKHVVERHGAELRVEESGDLPPVVGDETLIQQVVVNLLSNAADAIDGVTDGRRREVRVEMSPRNEWVELKVRDNGVGMTPEVREHIFEAFYTTKQLEKGTGLGLSLTRRIVEDLGGEIRVFSEPGRGAEFAVLFKVAQVSAASI
ncbi:GHKL domain-containing protein [bacterium]|nr:GHKL domain-containing protein [bacterium]